MHSFSEGVSNLCLKVSTQVSKHFELKYIVSYSLPFMVLFFIILIMFGQTSYWLLNLSQENLYFNIIWISYVADYLLHLAR